MLQSANEFHAKYPSLPFVVFMKYYEREIALGNELWVETTCTPLGGRPFSPRFLFSAVFEAVTNALCKF